METVKPTEEQKLEFLKQQKQVVLALLKNTEEQIIKADLSTFEKMILEKKIFRSVMCNPRFTYSSAISITMTPPPTEQKLESQ